AYLPLGLIIAAIMVAEISVVLVSTWWNPDQPPPVPAADFNNVRAIGLAMYTEYGYAVQIAAVLLLVGMIAAITLTLRRRTDVKRNNPSEQLKVQPSDRIRLVQMPAQPRTTSTVAKQTQSGDQA